MSATQRWLDVRKIRAVLTEVNLAIQRQALRGILKVELGGTGGGSGIPSKADRLKEAQKENLQLRREVDELRVKLSRCQEEGRKAKGDLEREITRNRDQMKSYVCVPV